VFPSKRYSGAPSGLVKTCQVCAPFEDRRAPLNLHFFEKLLYVLHVGLPIWLRPLDRVEVGASSFPQIVEHEFTRPFGSFMNDAPDEFRLLRATVEYALYLDEECFSLTRLHMVMEAQ